MWKVLYVLVCASIAGLSSTYLFAETQTGPNSFPGGVYISSPATLQTGQTSKFLMTNKGALVVDIGAGTISVTPSVLTYTPLGYCKLSATTSASVLVSTCSGGIPTGATYALICNEGSEARWRDDGTAPTTSLGQILGSGTTSGPTCFGYSASLSALQFIAQTGTATFDISFYK